MLKKFQWPSLYSPNPREKIFFSEIFSTNQNLRKNQIQLFDFFIIGIERRANTDAEKIPLTFVVFYKSARKKFFYIRIFRPIRIREKIKFNYSIFSSLESRDQWTVMLKKFYWPLLNSPNPREKFFFIKFFQPIRIREKIKFNSSIFLSLKSRDQWTVMLKKFYWPLLKSPNPREKFFFL